MDFSQQYSSLPSAELLKKKREEEEQAALAGMMRSEPVQQDTVDSMLKLSAPKLESPEAKAMMSGRGEGQELTIPETPRLDTSKLESPDAKAMVKDYLSKKYNLDPQDEAYMKAQGEAALRDDEKSSEQKFRSGMGMGIQQMIAGLGGTEPANDYNKAMLASAENIPKLGLERRKAVTDYLEKKYERELKKASLEKENKMLENSLAHQKFEEDMATKREAREQKASDAKLAKDDPNAPLKTRLAALSGEQQKRVDNERMGAQAVSDMKAALAKGDSTFRLVGSNDFTVASARFEEALGRLQSGGQISQKELDSFKAMRPTSTDSREMQAKKLDFLEKEMEARLNTSGFSGKDFNIGSAPSGPVKVRKGSETLLIPASDVSAAQKDGYEVVR